MALSPSGLNLRSSSGVERSETLKCYCTFLVQCEDSEFSYWGWKQLLGFHSRRSRRIWFSLLIHRFRSSFVSALSQFLHRHTQTFTRRSPLRGLTCVGGGTHLVTHKVFWHWVTSVSLSSSLWGRTVISSRVLGRAQNSRFTGPTCLLVQLARLTRPIGFWHQEGKTRCKMTSPTQTCCFCALPSAPRRQDTSSRRCSSQTGRTTVGATPRTRSRPQTCSERRHRVSSTPAWSSVTLLCRHSPGSPSAPPWNPPHTAAAGRCDLLEDTRRGPAGQTHICPNPAESTTDGLWSCDLCVTYRSHRQSSKQLRAQNTCVGQFRLPYLLQGKFVFADGLQGEFVGADQHKVTCANGVGPSRTRHHYGWED